MSTLMHPLHLKKKIDGSPESLQWEQGQFHALAGQRVAGVGSSISHPWAQRLQHVDGFWKQKGGCSLTVPCCAMGQLPKCI